MNEGEETLGCNDRIWAFLESAKGRPFYNISGTVATDRI